MSFDAKQRFESAEVIATVIRADGTRHELGTISYWHKNPLKRMVWKLKQSIAQFRKTGIYSPKVRGN